MTIDKAAPIPKDADGPFEGVGAFFYPPIAVVRGSSTLGNIQRYGKRHVNVRVDVNRTSSFIATDDGFIGTLLLDEEKAFEVLNTLFAIMSLTWGIPGFVLTKDDLSTFTYSPKEWSLDIHIVKPQVERNMFSFMRDNEVTYPIWRFIPMRTAITSDQFRTMVFQGYLVLSRHQELNRDLLLLFEGYTLLSKGALNGAYLYGWMMIETFLDELWGQYVDSLNRSKKEKKSLKHHDGWTSYNQIEVFSLLERIDPDSRVLLNRLRKTRNDIVHKRRNVSVDEANECLGSAFRILRNRSDNSSNPLSNISSNAKTAEVANA